MTPERLRRLEEVYHGACDRPVEQREAFLLAECGSDEELLRRVRALLAHEHSSPLEMSLTEVAARLLGGGKLKPGAMLGPYRIERPLGEGGMGDVYLGCDTRLGRDVAIKVLREEFGSRFQREARAISALNHPHICTLYDVGPDYLVMEYAAGQTLQERIGRKGLPLKEAVDYAIQIADALVASHTAGILHRDIKPGNIMVTAGAVKVLDFGLARRVQLEPEQTATMTAAGEIAGTPAYMSPEQVEGKPLDPRSDIFSFGVVLYEMVTGRRAFARESALSTISAVLHDEPKPVDDLTPDLKRVLGRCLRKDPGRRYQNMADLKVELEELRDGSNSTPAPTAPGASGKRFWILGGAVAVILVAAGIALGVYYFRPASDPPRLVRLTALDGREIVPAFSPDGKQVAFAWNGEGRSNYDLYVKFVGETTALRLTSDPAPDTLPAWSPDGTQIAFFSGRDGGGIYLVSPLGGPERKVAASRGGIGGRMCWSRDGKFLLTARTYNEAHPADGDGDLVLIPADGGSSPRRILEAPKGTRYREPALSPDGRTMAFFSCLGGSSAPTCAVQIADVTQDLTLSGQPRPVTTPQSLATYGLAWAADGESIIFGKLVDGFSWLWRVSLRHGAKPERLELTSQGMYPSIDATGRRLAFSRPTDHPDIWRLNQGESPSAFLPSSVRSVGAQFSPDGRRVAFESARGGGDLAVWIANADGTGLRQVTKLSQYCGTPRWSPDGRQIAFDAQREGGGWDVWTIEESGIAPRQLTNGPGDNAIPSWSRDGKSLYFTSNRSGRFEVWRVSSEGGPAQQITRGGGDAAFESEDGKTLYYTVSEAGVEGLHAKQLPDGEEGQVIEDTVIQRGFAVSADGIYYLHAVANSKAELRFFTFVDRKTQVVGTLDGPVFMGLSVSPDRKTFLYSKIVDVGADLMMIENFR